MYLASVRLWDWGRAAAVAALVAGVICVSEAAWIHVKASLAQALIGAAWRRELARRLRYRSLRRKHHVCSATERRLVPDLALQRSCHARP